MIRGEIVLLLMFVPFFVGMFVELSKGNGYRGIIGAMVGALQSVGYVLVSGVLR